MCCGVWLLASLAACDDSTQPAEPSSTPPAAAVAVAVAQQFTVRDLGTLGGTISHANSINEQGEVAGVAQNAAGQPRAFLWRAGHGMRSLGTLGGSQSRARGINDRTEVVGFSEIHPGSPVTRAFLWSEDGRHAEPRHSGG